MTSQILVYMSVPSSVDGDKFEDYLRTRISDKIEICTFSLRRTYYCDWKIIMDFTEYISEKKFNESVKQWLFTIKEYSDDIIILRSEMESKIKRILSKGGDKIYLSGFVATSGTY